MPLGRRPGALRQREEAFGEKRAEISFGHGQVDGALRVVPHGHGRLRHPAGLTDSRRERSAREDGHAQLQLGREVVDGFRIVRVAHREGREGEALLHELETKGVRRRVGADGNLSGHEYGKTAALRLAPGRLGRLGAGRAAQDERAVLAGQADRARQIQRRRSAAARGLGTFGGLPDSQEQGEGHDGPGPAAQPFACSSHETSFSAGIGDPLSLY